MSYQPLHRDKDHKFKNGSWSWSENEKTLKFHPHEVDKRTKNHLDEGLKFRQFIDAAEEKIFREVFQRPNVFYDSDVVTLQDIKNLLLFTMNLKATKRFLEFVHMELFDKFLHSIVFYIDTFLMVLEFLLIRRDKEQDGKVRDTFSIKVERFLTKRLSDRRLLIAREYSKILLECNKDTTSSTSFPTRPSANKDLHFFESLIDFTIQCTFIAMHRRALNAISCELNRLFRTEFFNVARNVHCLYRFGFREKQILYGNNWFKNSMKNFRAQTSPLMTELLMPSDTTDGILKIGEEKYFGTSEYLYHLELEFTIPECHLHLIGCRRGILGNPKYLYDTMLNLNERKLKGMEWSEKYDPYNLMKRASIKIHTTTDNFAERRKNLSARLIIQREPYGGIENQMKLWRRKESIIKRNLKKSMMD